jgi:hypothetical protein
MVILFFALNPAVFAQQGWWSAKLYRSDGNAIPFTFEWKIENGKPVWYIHNATEKIKVDNITAAGDSFIIQMPVFESQFRVSYNNKQLNGIWLKGGAVKTQVMFFSAIPGNKRFVTAVTADKNIAGRWAVNFITSKSNKLSVAELHQTGNKVSGTFLNPTGDYRYLEGTVTNDSLFLSCFDGSHAFLFTAKIESNTKISDGNFFSGAVYKEGWIAIKSPVKKSYILLLKI